MRQSASELRHICYEFLPATLRGDFIFIHRDCAFLTNAVFAAPTASAPKIYSLEDVDKELTEGQVVMRSSHENTRAFFQSHAHYQVCKDMESVTVAVVRNSKVDKHADDIYIVARYNRDGTIGAMDVGPPQFSVGDLTSYCK